MIDSHTHLSVVLLFLLLCCNAWLEAEALDSQMGIRSADLAAMSGRFVTTNSTSSLVRSTVSEEFRYSKGSLGEQILPFLQEIADGLDLRFVNLQALAETIQKGSYPQVTGPEVATLAAETAASMSTQHPDYARLAARILLGQNYKTTPKKFSEAVDLLYANGTGFIHKDLADLVRRRHDEIDARIVHERDKQLLSYFGFKTLERSYLLKSDDGLPLERPQYLFMRVALGIHCCETSLTADRDTSEDERLQKAFETYDMMSLGYFTHASPTLFHSGTTNPQLCSCFLAQMSDDSIHGIYDTLKQCAVISKGAGGIGLAVSRIRARGTHIKGTRGTSNGLVPMLRVFDMTARYVRFTHQI